MRRFALTLALFGGLAITGSRLAHAQYRYYGPPRPAARAAGAAVRGTARAAGAAVRGTERAAATAARATVPSPYRAGYGPGYGPGYRAAYGWYGAGYYGPGLYWY